MEHFEYRLFRYQISKIPAVRPPNRLTDRISLRTMRPPPPQTDAEATVAWPKVLAALKEKMNVFRAIRPEEEQRMMKEL